MWPLDTWCDMCTHGPWSPAVPGGGGRGQWSAASGGHLPRVGGAARLPWESLSSLITSDRQAMLTLPHHSHNDFREFQMNYLII